jgi:ubiquinone/menaquinone biosynthesis C-methylase UbiE
LIVDELAARRSIGSTRSIVAILLWDASTFRWTTATGSGVQAALTQLLISSAGTGSPRLAIEPQVVNANMKGIMGILRVILPSQTRRGEAARRARDAVRVLQGAPVAGHKAAPTQARKVPSTQNYSTNQQVASEFDKAETDKLIQSWKKHDPKNLDSYLVVGYQNPRINGASILARHFFIRKLFGDAFEPLMLQELEFCTEANALLRNRAKKSGLKKLSGRFRIDPEQRARVLEVADVNTEKEESFEQTWHDRLSARSPAARLSMLEMACGSANDYRMFDSYGLAQHLDYTGVDLNKDNIANAKQRFPDVDFQCGNIMDLPYEDNSFDYVLAFDIFEHLSVQGMEQALAEAMRIARRGLVLTFFNMTDIPEHVVRPVENYHRNQLSAGKVQDLIRPQFSDIEATPIRAFLAEKFPGSWYYARRGWQITAERS